MNTLNSTMLAEIALALNRLTILKAIEMRAADIREGGLDKPSTYAQAEDDLQACGVCFANISDVVDDAENAIHSLVQGIGVHSDSVVEAGTA